MKKLIKIFIASLILATLVVGFLYGVICFIAWHIVELNSIEMAFLRFMWISMFLTGSYKLEDEEIKN